METVQWRSNHLRDDWSNIHTYESGETSGELSIIDIIHQIEHLPGIAIMGNHTISFRGVQYLDGTTSASPLVTAEIMVMDDETNPPMSSGEGGFSTGTILAFSVGGIIVFLVALLLISTISNREEGTLAGKTFRRILIRK